ncbi:Metaxin-1 homolog [Strongyloides ratti]|uniref:Metaxin-1 homolog n=1 Tax=Strongyloides ratti TaxID=34506 RepID=A0A090MYL3_STRRB|nr:Metaxin-1 homolog [Strongyloides ratti]CEF67384.1 Metaxin-1 homolog [Strongyloides ratti]
MSMELFVWPSDFDLLSLDVECLQFLAASKFCALQVTITHTANPSISPTKTLPYFKMVDNATKKVESITEFPKFVEYTRKCAFELVLDSELTTAQKCEVDAFYSLLKKTLHPAVSYLLWNDESNYSTFTRKWYSSKMPFPTNFYRVEMRRSKELQYIKARGLSPIDIIRTAKKTITQLSKKLGDKKYFFGDKPSSLDALIFGYLAPLIKLPLPSDTLQCHLQACSNLVRFVESILSIYLVIPEEQRRKSDKEKIMWEERKIAAKEEASFRKQYKEEKKNINKAYKDDLFREVTLFTVGALVLSAVFAIGTKIIDFESDFEDI